MKTINRKIAFEINRKNYFFIYSISFIFLFFSCIGIYLLFYHKSFLRVWDTYDMHYHEFIYFGRWIREAITTFHFPVWEPSIGYGADFLTTIIVLSPP